MTKQLVSKYAFDASAGTVTFTEFDSISLPRIYMITNVTDNLVIYNFVDPAKGGTVAGNVLTLDYDTTLMSNTDELAIIYDVKPLDPQYDRTIIGNARSKFRDGFSNAGGLPQPNPDIWEVTNTNGDHIINVGGDAAGASYLRISLNPFIDDSEVTLTSKEAFTLPMRTGFGISLSQRISGQEVFFGLLGCDDAGVIEKVNAVPDVPITGATASVTSNVATFTVANHGFTGGDRISIFGCAEHRLNVGPVTVTVVDRNTFTVPCTLGNGSTYNSTGGYVRHSDPFRYAKNGFGLLCENTTATNASLVSRRNGEKYRSANQTTASTAASQTNTSPYSDAFNSGSVNELYLAMDEMSFRSYAADSNAGMSGGAKYVQGIPDEELAYKLHIRARNTTGMTKPIARITLISKAGSTTATVTTDVPHGLEVGDYVQIYGVVDLTNFPNTTSQTAVASVPSATTFTIALGTSTTATSLGGVVFKNEASVLAPGIIGQTVQSIQRADGVLQLNGNATWSGPLPGEYVNVYGMTGPDAVGLNGAYKVLRTSGSALYLEAPGPDLGWVSTGGAVIRRTDVRLHFVRVMDYTRNVVEIVGGRGNTTDTNNAVPVTVAGAATIGTNTTITTTTSTTGAMSRHRLLSAATTNATSVKTSGGRIYTIHAHNTGASARFLKFYNKNSAPTVGTDTPVETYVLDPGLTRISFDGIGNSLSSGIAYAVTGAVADNDTTAIGANEVILNIHYI